LKHEGMLTVNFGTPSYIYRQHLHVFDILTNGTTPLGSIKFTLACRFWSLLFTQEINVKEETFGISSSSTSIEYHEARHKSRHLMNMTPNVLGTEA
jgi:hypothetical protein